MSKKYLVIADYVYSKTDRDRHFINIHQLMKLYGVNQDECVCMDGRFPRQIELYQQRFGPLIELRPKFNGNYEIPKGEKNESTRG